jgi:hypothetical protein
MNTVEVESFLKKYPNLADVFAWLQSELQKDGARPYTKAKSIRFPKIVFEKKRVFAKALFCMKSITLELWVGKHEVAEKGIKRWASHNPEWVNTKIYPANNDTETVARWIEKARKFKG